MRYVTPTSAPAWFWNIRYGAYTFSVGGAPDGTHSVWPSISRAVAENVPSAGFGAPLADSRPLFHVFVFESRMMNQQNISTYGFAAAICSACFANAACLAFVTPSATSGFVCWPYSVT